MRLTIHGDKDRRLEVGPWSLDVVAYVVAVLLRRESACHGAPALVLAQHLGRNLRFKGSPLCDRPRSNSCRHQCRSRQAPSEHARPVLGQRTTVVIEQIPCLCGLCADISVRNVRPHNARARTCLKSWFNDGAPSFLYREICNGQLRLEPPLPLFYLDSIWLKSQS